MAHEGFVLAEALETHLKNCGFDPCLAEFSSDELDELLEDKNLLEDADSALSLTVSPEDIQGSGMYCRDRKNANIIIHVQICAPMKACTKQDRREELRVFLEKVHEIRRCVCELDECLLPPWLCVEGPPEFAEVPTDEDQSTLCLRFRQIQFSFGAAVSAQA